MEKPRFQTKGFIDANHSGNEPSSSEPLSTIVERIFIKILFLHGEPLPNRSI